MVNYVQLEEKIDGFVEASIEKLGLRVTGKTPTDALQALQILIEINSMVGPECDALTGEE